MILGKESTPYYILHLLLVMIIHQNPPKKYEYFWVFFLQNIIYSSTYDHCFGEKSWGKTTDTLKRNWPK